MIDARIQQDIKRLTQERPGVAKLPGAIAPDTISAKTALGLRASSSVSSGGIASPLTEVSRTLHATQAVSSDGLFVWSVPDVITMFDDNGATVELHFLAP
jgi:hypothetical protein